MSTENPNLIPTNKFRWRGCHHLIPTVPEILEQFFLDKTVLKEDGTPAKGVWVAVPLIEVVDE